jgi:AFG3 family protein
MNEPINNASDSKKSPSGRGFALWWLYLFAFLLMWLLPIINGSNTGDEITWQQFEKDILSRKAVEKITIVNNERADIYIKKEMASDSMFYKVLKPSTGKEINAGPH